VAPLTNFNVIEEIVKDTHLQLMWVVVIRDNCQMRSILQFGG